MKKNVENMLLDLNSMGINKKMGRKYNALIHFVNNDTILENGCINYPINQIEYVRTDIYRQIDTEDCIVFTILKDDRLQKITIYDENIYINRKYNVISIK